MKLAINAMVASSNAVHKHAHKPSTRVLTRKQKDKIIRRFQNEMAQKEKDFQNSVENEVKLLRMKFNNRLNKILRKFWDVKLEDVLNVEREISGNTPLTLFHVIAQLESLKKSNDNAAAEGDRNTEKPDYNKV